MAERYKIATVTPAKYRAGSVGSGDPTPQPFGFPKDGGAVSPAEMSGFFLPEMVFRHRDPAFSGAPKAGRRSDLLHFLKLWDCFVPPTAGLAMTYFTILPGAAGHHRFADTRVAAVTLTPSPRPLVGDFFCLLTNPHTVIARSRAQ